MHSLAYSRRSVIENPYISAGKEARRYSTSRKNSLASNRIPTNIRTIGTNMVAIHETICPHGLLKFCRPALMLLLPSFKDILTIIQQEIHNQAVGQPFNRTAVICKDCGELRCWGKIGPCMLKNFIEKGVKVFP